MLYPANGSIAKGSNLKYDHETIRVLDALLHEQVLPPGNSLSPYLTSVDRDHCLPQLQSSHLRL